MTSTAEMLESLTYTLESAVLRFSNEAELHEGIAEVLVSKQIPFEREVIITSHDRLDFLVGDIAIEVKVDGSAAEVLRQLHRYAQHERIGALILVTSRSRHQMLTKVLNGKPLECVYLIRSML